MRKREKGVIGRSEGMKAEEKGNRWKEEGSAEKRGES